MNESTPALGRIMQIAISVRDIRRAVTFYRETLGLRFLFEAPPALAFFDCAGVRLMLSAVEGETPHASVLYFQTSDIDATHEMLRAKGVQFEEPPHSIAKLPDREVFIAAFRDSEQNLLALMEERAL